MLAVIGHYYLFVTAGAMLVFMAALALVSLTDRARPQD